jgi:thiopurine S-methyltransferase
VEPDFWRDRWQKKEIGFHQAEVHDQLQQHWGRLGLAPGAHVFVPLCGKSLDMVWLAEQGHQVVGVELSELAVDEFFQERGLTPEVETAATLAVKRAGPYELWCGDFFAMPPEATASVAGVYDRAALVALPPDMRARYAERLVEVLPPTAQMLTITFDYDQDKVAGPPFAVPRDEVRSLFGDSFVIDEIAAHNGPPRIPRFSESGIATVEECAFILRRR